MVANVVWGSSTGDIADFVFVDGDEEWSDFLVQYMSRLASVYEKLIPSHSMNLGKVKEQYVLHIRHQEALRKVIDHPRANLEQKVLIVLSTFYNLENEVSDDVLDDHELDYLVDHGKKEFDEQLAGLIHAQNYAFPFFNDFINVKQVFSNFGHYRAWFYNYGFLFGKIVEGEPQLNFPPLNLECEDVPRTVLIRVIKRLLENPEYSPLNQKRWNELDRKSWLMYIYYVGPYKWGDRYDRLKELLIQGRIHAEPFMMRKKIDSDRGHDLFVEDFVWMFNDLLNYVKSPKGQEQMNTMLNFFTNLEEEECLGIVLSSYEDSPHPINVFYALAESGIDYPHVTFLNIISIPELNEGFNLYNEEDDLYTFMLLNNMVEA